MTITISTPNPNIEQHILQTLQQEGATVVLVDHHEASQTAPQTPSTTAPAPRQRRGRRSPHLSVRELVQNVLTGVQAPLTTREVTERVNETKEVGRKGISSRAVYNVLYRGAKDGNMVHLGNGTWSKLPMTMPSGVVTGGR